MKILTIILVLGTQYDRLQFERADLGITLLEQNPGAIILFAGGEKRRYRKYNEFYSEGARMLRSAIRHTKTDPKQTLVETFSKNTAQNAICAPYIWKSACLQPDNVIIITHKFHEERARKIFKVAWENATWYTQFQTIEDPEDVEWRTKLEIELMKNVESDLKEAIKLRTKCSTADTCMHLTKGIH